MDADLQDSPDEIPALYDKIMKEGYDLVSGGTDTHLVLIDLSNKNITGKLAEKKLEEIALGKQTSLLKRPRQRRSKTDSQ